MTFSFYKNFTPRVFLFLCITGFLFSTTNAKTSNAGFFTYRELTTLYESEKLPLPLQNKLDSLLTTPFVNNDYQTASPVSLPHSTRLGGEFLRVAEWNIERGLQFEAVAAAFGSEDEFVKLLDEKRFPVGSDDRLKILEEAAALRAADVIVLNEVDWGMKRTDYRNVAAELAARLNMNYAFGVEFVELSPVHLSEIDNAANDSEKEIDDLIKVDPARYKGLHGIAILSRLPLENVRLVPFVNQPYDWFESEKRGASLLEKGKRKISQKIFLEKTLREVRRGGRTILFADIADTRLPNGRVTIAATHLENRTKAGNRVKQLKELLTAVKDVQNPVIVAGDMNTSSADLTPTSISRELGKRFGSPDFWIKKSIAYALGFGFIEDTLLDGVTFWRNHSDPTVRNIPIMMPNPERKFFSTLEDFRFDDGGAFDSRGDQSRSFGEKNKPFANSNQRGGKGFVNTYQVSRPIKFIGKYKLDWILIKPPALKNPDDENAPYLFAPHFGRTLEAVNRLLPDRISDHRPMIVDLPLTEPPRNNQITP